MYVWPAAGDAVTAVSLAAWLSALDAAIFSWTLAGITVESLLIVAGGVLLCCGIARLRFRDFFPGVVAHTAVAMAAVAFRREPAPAVANAWVLVCLNVISLYDACVRATLASVLFFRLV